MVFEAFEFKVYTKVQCSAATSCTGTDTCTYKTPDTIWQRHKTKMSDKKSRAGTPELAYSLPDEGCLAG